MPRRERAAGGLWPRPATEHFGVRHEARDAALVAVQEAKYIDQQAVSAAPHAVGFFDIVCLDRLAHSRQAAGGGQPRSGKFYHWGESWR